jgi:hypothetical protein
LLVQGLEERQEFPSQFWRDYPDTTERLLKLVAEHVEWPNHHFIPDDPFGFLLVSAWDDMPWWELHCHIKQHIPILIDGDGILEIARESRTVGDFVRAALP